MKVICYLFLVFSTFRAQSGGGDSGGGGSDGGSSFDSGSDIDGESDCDGTCYGIVFGIVGFLMVFIISFIFIKRCRKQKEDNQLKVKLLKNFISRNISNEISFQIIIEIISQCSWKMNYVQNQKIHQVHLRNQNIQIINGTENNKFPYLKIEIEAEDEYGSSKLDGAIIQIKDGFKIFMLKDYENKNLASQTGDYSILVYEGQTKNIEEGFSGSWYFQLKKDSNGSWMWKS